MKWNNTRENKLIFTFGALTSIAACLYGGAYILSWRQAHKPPRIRIIRATPEHMAQALRRTKELREKWRPWVLSHQKELALMRTSNAPDTIAFQKVYDALPTQVQRETIGFNLQDLSTGQTSFAFCIGSEHFLQRPEVQKDRAIYRRFEKGAEWQKGYLAHNYAMYRDIPYLKSMGTGAIGYTLWASGRITESSMSTSKTDRRNPYNDFMEREVVPAL